MVLKERPQWLTCWFIPVIEICALKHSQDQLSSGQSCKANQHLSSAKLCLPSTLVLGEAKHFQKHTWIIQFVHSPCCLEKIKTAKYATAKTTQTVNAENWFAISLSVRYIDSWYGLPLLPLPWYTFDMAADVGEDRNNICLHFSSKGIYKLILDICFSSCVRVLASTIMSVAS